MAAVVNAVSYGCNDNKIDVVCILCSVWEVSASLQFLFEQARHSIVTAANNPEYTMNAMLMEMDPTDFLYMSDQAMDKLILHVLKKKRFGVINISNNKKNQSRSLPYFEDEYIPTLTQILFYLKSIMQIQCCKT